MKDEQAIQKHRMAGLDILRIICALLIFMRHSITMFGCTYVIPHLDGLVVQLTNPVMSTFFIISGFSLYYSYHGKPELSTESAVIFYKKRMITILPPYFLLHILWLFSSSDSVARWIVLTPFELTGLQSMYTNIFGILHNGGTWFISCLAISYFIFPLVRGLIDRLSHNGKLFALIAAVLLIVYIMCVDVYFQLGDNYTNPIFRAIEFFIGLVLMATLISARRQNISVRKQIILMLFAAVSVIVFLYCLTSNTLLIYSSISKSNLLLYPIIVIMLVAFYYWRCTFLENSRPLKYLSALSYYFFLMQFITWNLTQIIMNVVGTKGNEWKLLLSFAVCLVLSITSKCVIDKLVRSIRKSANRRSGLKI